MRQVAGFSAPLGASKSVSRISRIKLSSRAKTIGRPLTLLVVIAASGYICAAWALALATGSVVAVRGMPLSWSLSAMGPGLSERKQHSGKGGTPSAAPPRSASESAHGIRRGIQGRIKPLKRSFSALECETPADKTRVHITMFALSRSLPACSGRAERAISRGSCLFDDRGHGCGLRDIDRMARRNLLNR